MNKARIETKSSVRRQLLFWWILFVVFQSAERLFLLKEAVDAESPSAAMLIQTLLVGLRGDFIVATIALALAAIVGYPACKKEPQLAQATNVDGTRLLLESRSKDQRFLYASTGSIYGKVPDYVCNENTPRAPITLYGETKAAAEQMVLDAGNGVSYRYATAFGVTAWAWHLGLQTATLAFSTGLFLFVYKVAPSRRIGWRTALVAALFTAVAFELAKRLFALYVVRFATFDRLASDANVVGFFLFLLWGYYTCYVFLLGGEVAETYLMGHGQ